jgi:hypothetical protein
MPGETLSFTVTALDQAGNRQPAVWSVTENNENQSDRRVKSVITYSTEFHPIFTPNYCICVG